MKKTALVAVLALATLGLAGCGGKTEEAAAPATAEASDAAATASDDAGAMGSEAAADASAPADSSTDSQGGSGVRPPAP